MLKLKWTDTAKQVFRDIRKRNNEGFPYVWRLFHAYMIYQTDQQFVNLEHGGTFRGQTWQPFKSKWVARGGTHRRTSTAFSARLGRKITGKGRYIRNRIPADQAKLMQDTGNLRRNAATHIFSQDSRRFVFGTFGSLVNYAALQQALRPYLFIQAPKDVDELKKEVAEYLIEGEGAGER